jgi:hypothetical protein
MDRRPVARISTGIVEYNTTWMAALFDGSTCPDAGAVPNCDDHRSGVFDFELVIGF